MGGTNSSSSGADAFTEMTRVFWRDISDKMKKYPGKNTSDLKKDGEFKEESPLEGVPNDMIGEGTVDTAPVVTLQMGDEKAVADYVKATFVKEHFEFGANKANEEVAKMYKTKHKPGKRAIAILRTYAIQMQGKGQTNVLAPMVSLAISKKMMQAGAIP